MSLPQPVMPEHHIILIEKAFAEKVLAPRYYDWDLQLTSFSFRERGKRADAFKMQLVEDIIHDLDLVTEYCNHRGILNTMYWSFANNLFTKLTKTKQFREYRSERKRVVGELTIAENK